VKTRSSAERLPCTYILPIKRSSPEDLSELTDYLSWVDDQVAQLIVVDGSPAPLFHTHHARWQAFDHVAPAESRRTPNGKVWGVLTGLDLAREERIVIADDDIRYDRDSLRRTVALLDSADLVRPQNYFEPQPWHALWDTARTLLNRATGGDWPGTLAVQRSLLQRTNGYDGAALFENLELVRTVRAAGGEEAVPLDLYVRRVPPTSGHFLSQRVRQAYDEFARPLRLAWQLALLPLTVTFVLYRPAWLIACSALAIAIAEFGRRRDGGAAVFPAAASFFAPMWLMERMVCSWLALGMRLRGGVPYGGGRLVRAATPLRALKTRFGTEAAD
jgi:hypothetical protein